MSEFDIIRAWKDEEYRKSLTNEQRASMPANPAGQIELTDADMGAVAGGTAQEQDLERTGSGLTLGCCSSVINECGFSWYLGTYGCCPLSYDNYC
jgi:mersacidin/lichenicidin family type 2 lantibiotic